MALYAVAIGRQQKVTDSWVECQELTKGFSGSKFKKVLSYEDGLKYIEEISLEYQGKLLNEFELDQKLIPSFTNKHSMTRNSKTEIYIGSDTLDKQLSFKSSELNLEVKGVAQYAITVSCLIATRIHMRLNPDDTPILNKGDSKLNHYYSSITETNYMDANRQLMYLDLLIENMKLLIKEKITTLNIYTDSNYLVLLLRSNILSSVTALKTTVRYEKVIRELYSLCYYFDGVYISYYSGKAIPEKLKYTQKQSRKLNADKLL